MAMRHRGHIRDLKTLCEQYGARLTTEKPRRRGRRGAVVLVRIQHRDHVLELSIPNNLADLRAAMNNMARVRRFLKYGPLVPGVAERPAAEAAPEPVAEIAAAPDAADMSAPEPDRPVAPEPAAEAAEPVDLEVLLQERAELLEMLQEIDEKIVAAVRQATTKADALITALTDLLADRPARPAPEAIPAPVEAAAPAPEPAEEATPAPQPVAPSPPPDDPAHRPPIFRDARLQLVHDAIAAVAGTDRNLIDFSDARSLAKSVLNGESTQQVAAKTAYVIRRSPHFEPAGPRGRYRFLPPLPPPPPPPRPGVKGGNAARHERASVAPAFLRRAVGHGEGHAPAV